MGKMMKAVVKYDNVAGATEVREVPVPAIGPDDVLVETAYIGICGSDPHMHHNKDPFQALHIFHQNVYTLYRYSFCIQLQFLQTHLSLLG